MPPPPENMEIARWTMAGRKAVSIIEKILSSTCYRYIPSAVNR
jgi:hypothetical protein